jgi:hypothetical protein
VTFPPAAPFVSFTAALRRVVRLVPWVDAFVFDFDQII